jgi:hypothetical protein
VTQGRRRKRKNILDWTQAVLDETKELVDDSIDRLRGDEDDDEFSDDLNELKRAVAVLNAKLDALTVQGKGTALL